VLSGVLTQTADWHWIFFVNMPAGILAGVRTRHPAARAIRQCLNASTNSRTNPIWSIEPMSAAD
jgi:hypothetical protein